MTEETQDSYPSNINTTKKKSVHGVKQREIAATQCDIH